MNSLAQQINPSNKSIILTLTVQGAGHVIHDPGSPVGGPEAQPYRLDTLNPESIAVLIAANG